MTNIVYREACGEDKAQGYKILPLMQKLMGRGSKPIHKHVDMEQALENLFEKFSQDLYVVGEKYLVAYLIAPGWCFRGDLLYELCIIDLYRDQPGKLSDVTAFLELQAASYGCIGVSVGTSLHRHDEGMVSELQSLGYTPDSYQHFKGVTPL